ncbi:uncharacterized protein LOC116409839 [Xenopus tropicalis]|uniref:Uncharacterized protein LOC116409839 n=1 Tax=Xenopus tropicalis TaxID=8364 RepID=A0A8J1JBZ2_XENTR|nr:uncharacterized protein LOC116409839 [Xenopus tropicalis]XP_031755399.1 uncharacterized protein LOC116409839 [Xenopus tropicalis]
MMPNLTDQEESIEPLHGVQGRTHTLNLPELSKLNLPSLQPKHNDGSDVQPPVGARLSAFQEVWTTEIQDAWVISIILRGYRLEFRQKPLLNHFVSTILPRDSQKRDFLFHYVQQLMLKQAVTLVSPPEQERGFYSPLFLVTKATGDLRPISDLRMLNKFLKKKKKTDFQDGNLSNDKVDDSSGRLDSLSGPKRRLFTYSDCSGASKISAVLSKRSALSVSLSSIWAGNLAQNLHEGAGCNHSQVERIWNTNLSLPRRSSSGGSRSNNLTFQSSEDQRSVGEVRLDGESSQKSSGTCSEDDLFGSPNRHLVGISISTEEEDRPHRASSDTIQKEVGHISKEVHESVRSPDFNYWPCQMGQMENETYPIILSESMEFSGPELVTNNSDYPKVQETVSPPGESRVDRDIHGRFRPRLGSTSPQFFISGEMEGRPSRIPSNILELRAIFQALVSFRVILQGSAVKVRTDNAAAAAYIREQGGTRSRSLLREVGPIMEWAQYHLLDLTAQYVPGKENVQADCLSRRLLLKGEWALNPAVFSWIISVWGCPEVDLMATHVNAKLPVFYSRVPSPGAAAVDALSQSWEGLFAYIFPPIPIILKVLLKIRQSKMTVIAILPDWPRRPWYPLLRSLSVSCPLHLPQSRDLLIQGRWEHPDPASLNLKAWKLRGGS